MERFCLRFLSLRQLELLWLNWILLEWLRRLALQLPKVSFLFPELRFLHKLVIIVHNSDHQLIIFILWDAVVNLNNLIANQYISHCILRPQSHILRLLRLLHWSCLATITSRYINFSNSKRVTLFSQLYIVFFIVWFQVLTVSVRPRQAA